MFPKKVVVLKQSIIPSGNMEIFCRIHLPQQKDLQLNQYCSGNWIFTDRTPVYLHHLLHTTKSTTQTLALTISDHSSPKAWVLFNTLSLAFLLKRTDRICIKGLEGKQEESTSVGMSSQQSQHNWTVVLGMDHIQTNSHFLQAWPCFKAKLVAAKKPGVKIQMSVIRSASNTNTLQEGMQAACSCIQQSCSVIPKVHAREMQASSLSTFQYTAAYHGRGSSGCTSEASGLNTDMCRVNKATRLRF